MCVRPLLKCVLLYYYQVQIQLFACCSSYTDFVIAMFGESQVRFVTKRILKDENLISEFLQNAEQFLNCASYQNWLESGTQKVPSCQRKCQL